MIPAVNFVRAFLIISFVFFFMSCRKPDLVIDDLPSFNLPPSGYTLVWSDEFDGRRLDATKWSHRLPGARREAYNIQETVSIDELEGALVINTYTENDSVFTGMISTQNTFNTKFGYFECRAKVDTIFRGYWPAFWVQSGTIGRTLNPQVDGVEMDVMEFFRGDPFRVENALHWNGYAENHMSMSSSVISDTRLDLGYHTYGMEWTPDRLRFFFDSRLVWEVFEPISHTEQFIILSTEVDNALLFRNLLPRGTKVYFDYVRVYKAPEELSPDV